MATNLEIVAKEKSLIKITVAFTDEDGAAVTPTALTWKLTDRSGTQIATGEVGTPDTSNVIAIYGNDLALQAGESADMVERRILVEATYNSSLGTGLPLKWAGAFMLENLAGVS